VLRVSGQRPVLALFFQINLNFTHYFASFCRAFCTIWLIFARFGCGFVLKIQDFEHLILFPPLGVLWRIPVFTGTSLSLRKQGCFELPAKARRLALFFQINLNFSPKLPPFLALFAPFFARSCAKTLFCKLCILDI